MAITEAEVLAPTDPTPTEAPPRLGPIAQRRMNAIAESAINRGDLEHPSLSVVRQMHAFIEQGDVNVQDYDAQVLVLADSGKRQHGIHFGTLSGMYSEKLLESEA